MTILLYYFPPNPLCRSVLMLAKYLGIHLNLKSVNISTGEKMKASFNKINPQYKIPKINDNGFILWDCHPIMTYLVMKYAKNDLLYPRNPEKRAIVEQRLYFNIDTLYDNISEYYYLVLRGEADTSDKHLVSMENAFELLDGYLHDSKFIAGNNLTIADFSVVASVCTAKAFGFDIGRYDNITAWYNNCEQVLEKYGFGEMSHIIGGFYRQNVIET